MTQGSLCKNTSRFFLHVLYYCGNLEATCHPKTFISAYSNVSETTMTYDDIYSRND